MGPRVAVVAAYHETNISPPSPPTWRQAKRWLTGGALFDAFADTATVVGRFLDGARHCRLEPAPGFGAYATPAGRETRPAFDAVAEHLVAALGRAEPRGTL